MPFILQGLMALKQANALNMLKAFQGEDVQVQPSYHKAMTGPFEEKKLTWSTKNDQVPHWKLGTAMVCGSSEVWLHPQKITHAEIVWSIVPLQTQVLKTIVRYVRSASGLITCWNPQLRHLLSRGRSSMSSNNSSTQSKVTFSDNFFRPLGPVILMSTMMSDHFHDQH